MSRLVVATYLAAIRVGSVRTCSRDAMASLPVPSWTACGSHLETYQAMHMSLVNQAGRRLRVVWRDGQRGLRGRSDHARDEALVRRGQPNSSRKQYESSAEATRYRTRGHHN